MTEIEKLKQKLAKIKSPPDWFKARIEWVCNQPIYTLEIIQAQFQAGIKQRVINYDSFKRTFY